MLFVTDLWPNSWAIKVADRKLKLPSTIEYELGLHMASRLAYPEIEITLIVSYSDKRLWI